MMRTCLTAMNMRDSVNSRIGGLDNVDACQGEHEDDRRLREVGSEYGLENVDCQISVQNKERRGWTNLRHRTRFSSFQIGPSFPS